MSYKALYRTYRPQTFADVMGQEVVVKTLQNAIANKKISHAYLFSGPRGTGKTSVARIFAKALNCANINFNEPCDNCISCQEISQGINPDVIEIDAASNNGVDEIRDIREKVKFLPSGSKYKIYIIDEVHMLSGGAFNALLKTLEEPPKHVIFILATTEPQKLPATIISRCQRYEFKALTVAEISERLRKICSEEDVNISEEALNSISESAEGAMRDALSILDQAISYGNKNIEIEDINGVTGSLSFEKIINLANAIEKKDVYATIENINELISAGKEVSKIINSLLVFYRDALLYKSVGNAGFTKYIFSKEQFQVYCLNITSSKILYFVDVLSDIQNKVKNTTTPNVFLEIALIKMCNISTEELDIIKRVTELENKLDNLGDIEISSPNQTPIDNEKINLLDTRINQIVSELNRLEIRSQLEKINVLGQKIDALSSSNINVDTRKFENELQILKDKVEEIDLFVNKDSESETYEELDERIRKIENQEPKNNVDLSEVYRKIETLEKSQVKNNSQPFDSGLEDKMVDLESKYEDLLGVIDQIKQQVDNNVDKQYEENNHNYDFSEISDKLIFLERRVYQIMAGELAAKKITKKETKKNADQIMLFGDDILSLADYENKNKEKYDFEDIEIEKKEIEPSVEDVVNKEENVQESEDYHKDEEPIFEKEVQEIKIENDPVNDAFEEPTVSSLIKEVIEEGSEDIEDAFIVSNIEKTETNVEESKGSNVEKQRYTLDSLRSEIVEETPKFTLNSLRGEPTEEKAENPIDKTVETNESEKRGLFETASGIIERPKVEKKPNNIVSKYFDIEKGQEVINKEHSSLVVREKKNQDENYILEKDLIAHENRFDAFSNNKPIEEEPQTIVEENTGKDKFASYNIKYIEQILHDSRSIESKNDKVRIEQLWKIMTRGARPEYLSIMETLQEGKIAVVGNKEFILVFPNVMLCNQVMRAKFKDVAIRILYNLLGDTYNYIALPIDAWTAKSIEYKQQYQIGIKYPTLTPLEIKGLEIISDEEEYKNDSERAIRQTLRLFGEDNVKFE